MAATRQSDGPGRQGCDGWRPCGVASDRANRAQQGVSTAVKKAGEQAAKNAAEDATKSGGRYLVSLRTDRKHRRLAMDLARQIGGKVSLGTVIAGERYYVVWRGDVPVDCFPVLLKTAGALAERPELSGFVGHRVTPPPK